MAVGMADDRGVALTRETGSILLNECGTNSTTNKGIQSFRLQVVFMKRTVQYDDQRTQTELARDASQEVKSRLAFKRPSLRILVARQLIGLARIDGSPAASQPKTKASATQNAHHQSTRLQARPQRQFVLVHSHVPVLASERLEQPGGVVELSSDLCDHVFSPSPAECNLSARSSIFLTRPSRASCLLPRCKRSFMACDPPIATRIKFMRILCLPIRRLFRAQTACHTPAYHDPQ